MQATFLIQSYTSDMPNARHLGYALALALLLHALVLLGLHFSPATTPPPLMEPIEVSLDAAAPGVTPPQKSLTSPPPKPEVPPEKPPEIIPEPPPPEPQLSDTPLEKPQPPQPEPTPVPPIPVIAQPTPTVATPLPSAPPAEEIQPIFRLTRMPSFQQKIEAVYPVAERRAGTQANVLAEVTIDSLGKVIKVRILKSGGTTFDEAVTQALQKSLFNPGMIEGKPVGTRFQVPFRFNLN
ncbi:MAG: TonB family protein [Gallionellaceae bacterium]